MDPQDLTLIGIVLVCAEILGILTSVHAIMYTRTSQGAVAWLFALLLIPIFSLPLYWVFGRNKFRGYLVARRIGDSQVQQIVDKMFRRFEDEVGSDLNPEEQRFRTCEKFGELPFLSGNRCELLIDGQETFDAIFAAIDDAQEYIFVEFFIIHEDELGHELQKRLIAKAQQGVRIQLIYDEIGSHGLSKRYRRALTDVGVEVRAFHSTRGWMNRFQLNFRNHRKIVVVDGRVAFVGGHNVGDEYMGKSKKFGHWRDTHLRVTGPAVTAIQLAFAEDWYWASSGGQVQGNWEIHTAEDPGQDVVVIPTGPGDELESCGLFFTHAINSARKRLWIASPYFVPEGAVMTALKLAALRGVDVRILLPAKADHMLVYLSSFSFIDRVAPAGVRFFRYEPGFMHQKALLVDDDFAAIGTANFDNRSFRLNFEITIGVTGKQFASEVDAMLTRDFEKCREATTNDLASRSFWFRLAVQSSRLMAPIQ